MLFNFLDRVVLFAYFGFLFGLAIYFSRRQKNTTDYFLAGRNSKWYAIGTSIFAANISSEHLISLAERRRMG